MQMYFHILIQYNWKGLPLQIQNPFRPGKFHLTLDLHLMSFPMKLLASMFQVLTLCGPYRYPPTINHWFRASACSSILTLKKGTPSHSTRKRKALAKKLNKRTGAKNEDRGMTSWSSIDKVPSESWGMKTFFTTGMGPWTSYKPILWLNVAKPNSDPGPRAWSKDKRKQNLKFPPVQSINLYSKDSSITNLLKQLKGHF